MNGQKCRLRRHFFDRFQIKMYHLEVISTELVQIKEILTHRNLNKRNINSQKFMFR